MTPTLLEAATALSVLGARVLRARRRDADGGEHAEDNTYGLPDGEPIADELREWLRRQREAVLAAIPDDTIPTAFPDLTAEQWTDPMAKRMTPLLGAYWSDSGKEVFSRLGLDPDEWRVVNPHLERQIAGQALAFCQSTNDTTSKRIGDALRDLRAELTKGMVEEGESVRELTKRVQYVFESMSTSHATMIAATEASRAVHAAELMADVESEVVAGLELLLSSDACPLCRKIATECKRVRLGEAFAVIGSNPHYKDVRHPPLHPHCQCTVIEVLKPEYGGPVDPKWGKPLDQPQKGLGAEYTPPHGKTEPNPEPNRPKPRPTKPPPKAPKPPEPGTPILPDRPIAERLAAYTAGDEKVAKIVEIHNAANDRINAIAAGRRTKWKRIEEIEDERNGLAARPRKKQADVDRILALNDEQKKLAAEREALKTELQAVKDGVRRDIIVSLAPPKPMMIAVEQDAARDPAEKRVEHLGPQTQGAVQDAQKWLGSVLQRGESYRLTFDAGQIPDGQDQRAYYSLDGKFVALKKGERPDVVVHEFGHAIDEAVGTKGRKVVERSLEFLDHRVGHEVPRKMNDVVKGGGYENDESGRKDKFDRAFTADEAWYIGKPYTHQATEVLSMGLQKLYNDPVEFAKLDPEYCKWVLGILDGSLR